MGIVSWFVPYPIDSSEYQVSTETGEGCQSISMNQHNPFIQSYLYPFLPHLMAAYIKQLLAVESAHDPLYFAPH